MNIRRGAWVPETYNKTAAVKAGRFGARAATVPSNGTSNSDNFMKGRARPPEDSIPSSVSEHRKENIIRGTAAQAQDTQNTAPLVIYSNSYRRTQEIKKSFGFDKTASISSPEGGVRFGFGSGTNTNRQAPEVYSPLFQI